MAQNGIAEGYSSCRLLVAVESGTDDGRITEHRQRTQIVSILSSNVKIASHFY